MSLYKELQQLAMRIQATQLVEIVKLSATKGVASVGKHMNHTETLLHSPLVPIELYENSTL